LFQLLATASQINLGAVTPLLSKHARHLTAHSLTSACHLNQSRAGKQTHEEEEEEEEEEALIGAFDGCLGLIGKHGEQLAPRWKLRQG